jgi:cell division protein FtsI/penicillin-binding protein 2
MDAEGIYRKSGGNSQVQAVKESFERSAHDYDLSDPDLDINAVTSCLKQYFRRLPNPLITYEVYDKVLETTVVNEPSVRIEALARALSELPKVHWDVLEHLMMHLSRVVERNEENLMKSSNNAVVFAPTIMRPESLSREMTDTAKKNEVVQFLVENCRAVFKG